MPYTRNNPSTGTPRTLTAEECQSLSLRIAEQNEAAFKKAADRGKIRSSAAGISAYRERLAAMGPDAKYKHDELLVEIKRASRESQADWDSAQSHDPTRQSPQETVSQQQVPSTRYQAHPQQLDTQHPTTQPQQHPTPIWRTTVNPQDLVLDGSLSAMKDGPDIQNLIFQGQHLSPADNRVRLVERIFAMRSSYLDRVRAGACKRAELASEQARAAEDQQVQHQPVPPEQELFLCEEFVSAQLKKLYEKFDGNDMFIEQFINVVCQWLDWDMDADPSPLSHDQGSGPVDGAPGPTEPAGHPFQDDFDIDLFTRQMAAEGLLNPSFDELDGLIDMNPPDAVEQPSLEVQQGAQTGG